MSAAQDLANNIDDGEEASDDKADDDEGRGGEILSDAADDDVDEVCVDLLDSWHAEEDAGRGRRTSAEVHIDRKSFTQERLRQKYGFISPQTSRPWLEVVRDRAARRRCSKSCSASSPRRRAWKQQLCSLFPFLSWLPAYRWRDDLGPDVSAGVTVGIMHIPQGLAYGALASAPAITGLYTGFFPVLAYILLGTSPHASMGTLAVTSLLVAKPVQEVMHEQQARFGCFGLEGDGEAAPPQPRRNATSTSDNQVSLSSDAFDLRGYNANHKHEQEMMLRQDECLQPIDIVTCVTMVAGLIQILLGLLRLGRLNSLLSPSVVSGFTTGAACHVATSQTYSSLFVRLSSSNAATLGLSAACVALLVLHEAVLRPCMARRGCRFTAPIQLLLVAAGTAVSFACGLERAADVQVVGQNIPTGFPSARLPAVVRQPQLILRHILKDSFIVAVVAYVISLSLSKMLAEKHGYEVRPNQELFAQGVSSVFGSCFSSLPLSASLSRTLVQEQAGCKTMMTSVVSVFLLFWVLLFIGPVFQYLPNAVLASIIVVALKGMFLQFKDLLRYAKSSSSECAVWLATFLATVVVDVDVGLAVGAAAASARLLYWGSLIDVQVVVPTEDADIFIDPTSYKKSASNKSAAAGSPPSRGQQRPRVLKLAGSLNFANATNALATIERHLRIEPKDESSCQPEHILLDLSCISRLDASGCETLAKIAAATSLARCTHGGGGGGGGGGGQPAAAATMIAFCGMNDACLREVAESPALQSISERRFYPTLADAMSAADAQSSASAARTTMSAADAQSSASAARTTAKLGRGKRATVAVEARNGTNSRS